MTKRSFYAKQDEKGCSEHGGVAVELIDHSVSGPMMIEGPLGPELSHHPGRPGGVKPDHAVDGRRDVSFEGRTASRLKTHDRQQRVDFGSCRSRLPCPKPAVRVGLPNS